MKRLTCRGTLALLVMAFFSAVPGKSLAPVTDKAYRSVGERIICQCGCMQTVYGCNHYGCQDSDRMRKEVRAAIASTDSDDAAVQQMVDKYGIKALTEPPKSGFNLTAWIMPFAVLLAGATLIIFILRAWRRHAVHVAASAPPVDPALLAKYASKIDEEIDKD